MYIDVAGHSEVKFQQTLLSLLGNCDCKESLVWGSATRNVLEKRPKCTKNYPILIPIAYVGYISKYLKIGQKGSKFSPVANNPCDNFSPQTPKFRRIWSHCLWDIGPARNEFFNVRPKASIFNLTICFSVIWLDGENSD
jgi:hypothetical protein